MATRFRPNPRFQAEARAEGWPAAATLPAAEQIRTQARANARDSDYGDSLEVVRTPDGAQVTTDYPFAHLDEWGSVKNPPTAALRRATRSVLGRLREAR